MFRLYSILLVLALVSFGLVVLRPYLPVRTLLLESLEYQSANVFAEGELKRNSTGSSKKNHARWTKKDYVECTIVTEVHKGVSPVCGINIQLGPQDSSKGIDLSGFTHLDIEVIGDVKLDQLRITAVTSDERVYDPSNRDSLTKSIYLIPNEVFSNVSGTSFQADLRDFTIAEWWLEAFGLTDDSVAVSFASLFAIMLDVTPETPPGTYQFKFGQLKFTGAYLSANSLYRILALSWLAGFFSIALYLLYQNLRDQKAQLRLADTLREKNSLLSIRSDQIKRRAFTDLLTQTLNRKGLQNALQEDLPDAACAVLLIDLDRFKQVNDTFGHGAGDQVLQELAEILLLNSRKSDLVSRWGGEEFVIFCPGCSLSAAANLAEKIRSSIAIAEFHKTLELSMTVSIGVAACESRPNSLSHFLMIVDQADKNMYRAKRAGGNQVFAN